MPTLAQVLASHPNLVEQRDLTQLALENEHLRLTFSPATGAIDSLLEKATTVDWAAGDNRTIGEFVYRTYTQEHDMDRFVKAHIRNHNGAKPKSGFETCFAIGSQHRQVMGAIHVSIRPKL